MWIIFSQISALSESVSNLLAKKLMSGYNSTVVTWFWVVSSTIFLGILVLFTGIPEIQSLFYWILLARIVLDTVALLLFTRALQLEEVSLITPLFNFSAVFSLLFSFFINKELPSLFGIFGILLIVAGAYLLNFDSDNSDLFHPIVNILKRKHL